MNQRYLNLKLYLNLEHKTKQVIILKILKKISQHAGAIYAVAYCKKLDLILTGGADKVVASWNPNTFENTPFSIKTQSAIVTLQVINEKYLFIGLFNGHFHIIDIENKKEVKYFTKHKKGIYACTSEYNSNILIVGSGDGMISIWDIENFTLLFEQKIGNGKIRAIECINDKAFIGNSEGKILIVDLKDFKLMNSIDINSEGINSICYIASKNAMLVGGKNAWIYVFDIKNTKVVHSFPAHNWAVYKIINNKNSIYSCSRDKTIKEWDNKNLELKNRYCWPEYKSHTHSVNNMIYIENHEFIVSVSDDKSIIIWQ